jgi:hypothetical protein
MIRNGGIDDAGAMLAARVPTSPPDNLPDREEHFMRTVTQLAVRISSEDGSVSNATRLLGDVGVDIKGFSVSDTVDHSVLRLIVDAPDKALRAFQAAGMHVVASEVLVVVLPDHPGGLAGVLREVADAGISIEYVYSLISTFVVLNVTSPERACALLEGRPVTLVTLAESEVS